MTSPNFPSTSTTPKNRFRLILVGGLVLGLVILVIYWSRLSNPGYEEPTQCVEAFYNAALDGEEGRVKACLSDSLQEEAASLISQKKDLEQLVQKEDTLTSDTTAFIDTEEIRSEGIQQVRIYLEKSNQGWVIVRWENREQVSPLVPHGTPVDQVPNP